MAWSEIFIILCVAILLIRPQDLPKIIRIYKDLVSKFNIIKQEISANVNLIAHNQEIMELEEMIKKGDFIKDSHPDDPKPNIIETSNNDQI